MVIRLLDRGLSFDIVPLNEEPNTGLTIKGTLYDTERNTILLLDGKEFYDYCETKASPGARFELTFYKGPLECTLQGRLNRTFIKFNNKLVEIEATTGIMEKNRRSSPRLDIAMPIKLYAQTGNAERKLLCNGQNCDISAEAICFLSNTKVEMPEPGTKLYVEFTMGKVDYFSLQAKMIRRGDSPQSIQFKHDYAFTFDYSENPDEKSKLITAFLKDSIERRK